MHSLFRKNDSELALALYKVLYTSNTCLNMEVLVSVSLAIETIQKLYSIVRNDWRKYLSGHSSLVMVSVPGAGVGYADMPCSYNTLNIFHLIESKQSPAGTESEKTQHFSWYFIRFALHYVITT